MRPDYVALNREQTASEQDPFTVRRYRQFGRFLPKDCRSVLDVGCGTGRGGATLLEKRPEIALTGLDCVPERLDQLPIGVYTNRIESYSTEIPVEDGSFDAITAGEFIEHLTPDDANLTLCECARLLRPGGVLLLTTPNPDYIRNRMHGVSALGGAHLALYRPKELRQMLQQAGFSKVRVRGSGQVSSLLGSRFPYFAVYGSYLAVARK